PLHIERELPEIKTNNKLRYFGTAVGLAIWVGGMAWAFNYQRLCSAAVTSTLFVTRHHPVAIEALGEPIAFESGWPWISGTINQLKGIVEISMRIRGTKAAGVLSVKTYRSNNEWSDREFQLRLDNGRIINLLDA
ncbi:cytochrome oxidase assembly protein 1, partial [Dimargaris cristalligena]